MRVLVTRPKHQSEQLLRALDAEGYEIEFLPLLDIQPVPFSPEQRQQAKKQLQLADKLIAVSANAATLALSLLEQVDGLQELSRLSGQGALFAIGPSTAAVFEAEDYVVKIPDQQYNSETLLALDDFHQLSGQSVLLLCGQGGRDYLEQGLAEQDVRVTRLDLYKRVPLPKTEVDLERISAPDVLTAMSGDTVEALNRVLAEEHSNWKNRPLIVPSQRVAEIAKEKGFTKVLASAKPTTESLLNILVELE